MKVIDLKIALEKLPNDLNLVIDVSSENSKMFRLVNVCGIEEIEVDNKKFGMLFSEYEDLQQTNNN
jgi:chromosome segregation ATPase